MITTRRSLIAGAAGFTGLMAAGASRALVQTDIFPVVETAQGKVRGVAAGGIKMFKGLRYGASTAGKNRFMPPTAPPKWAGIRDTYAYGQIAPQMPNSNLNAYGGMILFDIQPGGMGEDCLVVNVWTPTLDKAARKPVMLHIHGGGYYGGSGNSPGFDGEELARFGDCVVITVNHRLGAFGYLNLAQAGPQFAHSGGVGMMDLVAALGWIKENAEAFGGDPNRVLAFGQSGGGAKTSALLSMPSAKGLFHRAGVMSGASLRLATADQAQAGTASFLKALDLKISDTAKLQALPYEALLTAQANLEAADRAKGEAPRSFSPSLDGTVLPIHPFDPGAPAVSADVPIIVSNVIDERSYRMSNFNLDENGLRAFIARRVGEGRADEVLAMYRADDPKATPFVLQARFDTDEVFRKSSIIATERKAAQGAAPVWSYLYREPSPSYGGRYGTPHGSDVGPSLHDVRGALNGTGPRAQMIADQLASVWVSFAATGDPNNKRIPHWPAYKVPERATLVLGGGDTRVENDPRGAFRKFWEKEPPRSA